ncbi:hypothetical protein EVAR_3707_1 [Eumeta japonica]|uniref:Uncharacterized protein n=1 Tax=Eumeta variegata TaxID=151549 RepID=A0A4C1SRI6_EUMVA|nr:hypothetical protein EVAR_3707_1 [Eumeta japonica]
MGDGPPRAYLYSGSGDVDDSAARRDSRPERVVVFKRIDAENNQYNGYQIKDEALGGCMLHDQQASPGACVGHAENIWSAGDCSHRTVKRTKLCRSELVANDIHTAQVSRSPTLPYSPPRSYFTRLRRFRDELHSGINVGQVRKILHVQLKVPNLWSRWKPHDSIEDTLEKTGLTAFDDNSKEYEAIIARGRARGPPPAAAAARPNIAGGKLIKTLSALPRRKGNWTCGYTRLMVPQLTQHRLIVGSTVDAADIPNGRVVFFAPSASHCTSTDGRSSATFDANK